MMRKLYTLIFLGMVVSGCGSDSVEPVTNKALTLTDVVDDKSLVDYLSGKWGYYSAGEQQKFANYEYTFDPRSNKMNFLIFQNKYFTINDPELSRFTYKVRIEKNVVSTSLLTIGSTLPDNFEKDWRFEKVSEDEMKVYWLSESKSGSSEFALGIFTKLSEKLKPASEVIKSSVLVPYLKGAWKVKNPASSIAVFDFTGDQNQYAYNFEELGGSKTTRKYEFKVKEDGVLYSRVWAQSIDPSWKKYKVETVSENEIRLYLITKETPALKPEYTLTR